MWVIYALYYITAILNWGSLAAAEEENEAWNKNHKLREQLLKNYDKLALPQKNVNGTADVYIMLFPRAIWIDDQKETLIVDSWISLDWFDERLKWDYKDFGGLDLIHFGDSELWKPDLAVFNNADITEIDHYGDVHFMVHSIGLVWWVPPATMKTYCPIDLKYWPFDQHTCKIRFGSWTSHGQQVNLMLYHNNTQIEMFVYTNMSSNWIVKQASQHRVTFGWPGYEEYYQEINFFFTLQRTSNSFTYCVVVPAIVLPLLILFQFLLPVDHEKRFTIGCCCTIFAILELMFLKFSLPRVGSNSPLIVQYYGECVILSVLTVGITALLGRLAFPQNPILAYPPPDIIKKILAGPLATVLCVRENAAKLSQASQLQEERELNDGPESGKYAHEWLIIAKAADRIAALVLTVIFVISLIVYV